MSRCNNTVLNQLIQEIPFHCFQKNVNVLKGDKGVSKISCESMLITLIYSQLSGLNTLRELEDSFAVNQSTLESLGINSVQKSSLSDALKKRNPAIFEFLFRQLLTNLLSEVKTKKQRKVLKLLDSTTISLSKSLHEWAEFRETKSGIKLHLVYDDKKMIPIEAIITNAKNNDTTIVDELLINAGDTFVFDRAYNIYKWWYKIHCSNAFFVTRMKKGTCYKTIMHNRSNKKDGVIEDNTIVLTGAKKNEYPGKLRLIKYYDAETKKYFSFITNNFSLKAQTIADYYKRRWQIELFFKFIKQHLTVKKFLSRSKNGIETQIWCALITYLLVIKAKMKSLIQVSAYYVLRMIRAALFKKMHLYALFEKKRAVVTKTLIKEVYLW